MLTKDKEGGRVKCHKYWPTSGAESFGQYQVIYHNSSQYADYLLRELKIVDTKVGYLAMGLVRYYLPKVMREMQYLFSTKIITHCPVKHLEYKETNVLWKLVILYLTNHLCSPQVF